jgi:SAM-dependent methyltransferase
MADKYRIARYDLMSKLTTMRARQMTVRGGAPMHAAETYATRVNAVLEQRTRVRGPQPPGDLFAGLPPNHPLLTADPRRAPEANLDVIAGYIYADDVIVDVGGGAGRFGLPLALHARELINVDPSAAMLAAFERNAQQAGITNVRAIHADWLDVEPPRGTVALVNHVTYLTRDIVPFIQKLEQAASRRVLITVGSPPPPSRNGALFSLVFDELSQSVPGYLELENVLWEMGIDPEVRMLPDRWMTPVLPSREAAIQAAMMSVRGHQWAFWPLTPDIEARAKQTITKGFD